MSSIAVFAKLTSKPDARDQLRAALEKLTASTDGEAGTLQYGLHQETGNPDVFWFYEFYSDKAALDAHSGSDAMAEAMGSLGGLLGEPPLLVTTTPLQGKNLPG